MTIWLDMDGTIADLYAVEGWLEMLKAEMLYPYDNAKPLMNLATVARLLNTAQRKGYKVGVISWTAKGGTPMYNAAVKVAKIQWLNKHLHSVKWDEIKVVPYGTNKRVATGGGILFDDEEPNRKAWGEGAYAPTEMVEVLKKLGK